MKNKQDLKKELINYLRKTSEHTFMSKSRPDHYLKVFFIGDKIMILDGDKIFEKTMESIDSGIDCWGSNYKRIVKMSLFGERIYSRPNRLGWIRIPGSDFVSIRNTKYSKSKIQKIIYLIENPPNEDKKQSLFGSVISALGF